MKTIEMKKQKTIRFPASDIKQGDTILEYGIPVKVVNISPSGGKLLLSSGGELARVGLVDLVSRAPQNELTYIQFRNQVHKLLKSQGVKRLPGWKVIRPYYNAGAGPDDCAVNYLSMIEY